MRCRLIGFLNFTWAAAEREICDGTGQSLYPLPWTARARVHKIMHAPLQLPPTHYPRLRQLSYLRGKMSVGYWNLHIPLTFHPYFDSTLLCVKFLHRLNLNACCQY
jgi:hypothetical protein